MEANQNQEQSNLLLQEQIEKLDAVNRLLENQDFQDVYMNYLNGLKQTAYRQICNPAIRGIDLEVERAKFIQARENLKYLSAMKDTLSKAIKTKQAGESKTA